MNFKKSKKIPSIIRFHDVVDFGSFFFDAEFDESGAGLVEFVEERLVFGESGQQVFVHLLLTDNLIGADGRSLDIHLLGFHFFQPLRQIDVGFEEMLRQRQSLFQNAQSIRTQLRYDVRRFL